jgi:hypothetical protein
MVCVADGVSLIGASGKDAEVQLDNAVVSGGTPSAGSGAVIATIVGSEIVGAGCFPVTLPDGGFLLARVAEIELPLIHSVGGKHSKEATICGVMVQRLRTDRSKNNTCTICRASVVSYRPSRSNTSPSKLTRRWKQSDRTRAGSCSGSP